MTSLERDMEADLEERLPHDRLVREIAAEHEDVGFGARREHEALRDRVAILARCDGTHERRGRDVSDRSDTERPLVTDATRVACICSERAPRLDIEKERRR